MKIEGQIESKFMEIETLKERKLIEKGKEEYWKGFQDALEWVISGKK